MKKLIYTFILLIGLTTVSCEKEKDKSKLYLLKRTWVHSYEEGYDIYRPSDYKKFPPSWFRQTFGLRDGYKCSYLVSAPNDGHYMEEGTWRFDEKKNILTILNRGLEVVTCFEILELKEDILKVKNRGVVECY